MEFEIMKLERRIALLRGRDPVMNMRIIRKMERRLRRLRASV